MHRRLTAIYLALLAVTTFGLALPLCLAVIDRASNELILDRTADAAYFSSLAENAVLTGQVDSLGTELEVYEQLFGIETVVLDAEANLVVASRPGLTLDQVQSAAGESAQEPAERVMTALAGVRQEFEGRIWPWNPDRVLVAEPVNDSGETIGVVVTASPTVTVARSVWIQWFGIAAGVLATLVLGAFAARPVSRWVLRPVAELAQAANAVGRGQLGAQVSVADGPDELKQLAGSFNAMSTTIEEILRRQGSFVAYAGHQIRNPLAVVRLRVESLGVSLSGEQREAHRIVLEELDRLTRTCQGLLSLALPAETELDRFHVDVAEVASRRQEAWMPIADRLGARIDVEVPKGLTVRTLENTLDQTLDVLIDNALKFGGAGVGVLITGHRVHSSQVDIIVEDDGPGVPDEMLQEAVIPFWRRTPKAAVQAGPDSPSAEMPSEGSAEHSAAKGTGLGLSAVVSLLELDNSYLELHHAEPQGIRAVICLTGPAATADEQLWPRDSSLRLQDEG